MTTNTTPTAVYRRGLRLLLDKNVAGWVDLWEENGILEFPFAPEGWPQRLEGRAAVAAYMHGYPEHIDLHDFPHVEIHQTLAPETIVVEMRGVGRLMETDSPFDMSYIAVVTVEDGLITRYRDYWNPLALQDSAIHFAGSPR